MAARAQVRFRPPPGVERELRAIAAGRCESLDSVVCRVVAGALGMGEPPPESKPGPRHRLAIARLADRGGWFDAVRAAEAAGVGWAVARVQLRELVRLGVLAERVVPGATGGRKEWASAEPLSDET